MIVVVTSRFYSLRGFEHYGRITELGSEMNCKFAQRVRILSFQALPSGRIPGYKPAGIFSKFAGTTEREDNNSRWSSELKSERQETTQGFLVSYAERCERSSAIRVCRLVQTDLSVTLRPFGSLLLCLLVFLHRFLLFLGCLGLRFLLLLTRLLSLARTVWAGEDLSFSGYRPCKTTGDQQYESRNSLHKCPRNGRAYADLTRSCVRAPAANPLRNITPVTLKNWLIAA